MVYKQLHYVGVFLFLLVLLSACSVLGEETPAGIGTDSLIYTQAAETVIAQLSSSSGHPNSDGDETNPPPLPRTLRRQNSPSCNRANNDT